MNGINRVRQILLLLTVFTGVSQGCTLAVGNFHQVTSIHGRIVGKNLGLLDFRWLRQSFSVSDATATLYEYHAPEKIGDLKAVAVIQTDSHGNFNFGSLPNGHYVLNITVRNSDRMGGVFYVEVTTAAKATKNITIDVSPIHPDCKGGHEFIETKA